MTAVSMQFAAGTLPDREQFERFILLLPAVEIVHQWGAASVGKVGGKIFAIWGMAGTDPHGHVSFKCSDMSFEMLPELDNIAPAKYLARAKWVDVAAGSPLTADDLSAYICEAHRLVAQKLPGKTKEKLGLP
jgi:predicted DNA-binding protein (MmcQ/YjbR family)